ncbi:hypothetical protein QUF93_00220 [Bacillus hominis]|uniref:hypothetical protein n=1 Tax=Bacillus hominis TaxID=2817478 RepID=UPI0025A046BA|nr:hypothetical protein [Bacillus hominis]MDM5191153.1 hypothetical protein [Bacillus hominis]
MQLQNIDPELKKFLYQQIYVHKTGSIDTLLAEGYMFDAQEIQQALDIFMRSELIIPTVSTMQIGQKKVDFMRNDEKFRVLKENSQL